MNKIWKDFMKKSKKFFDYGKAVDYLSKNIHEKVILNERDLTLEYSIFDK